MAMTKVTPKEVKISSLATPSKDDLKVLRSLSREECRALVSRELEKGFNELEKGNFIELNSDEDIEAFLDEIWAVDADTTV